MSSGAAYLLTETVRALTVLYTNDEHGWIQGYQNTDGAAGMTNLWRDHEGLGERPEVIALSGGDMWTGPALSTVWEGESMTEVMNAIGYTAAAVGNHDFDFGLSALSARAEQANFPFLSANMRDRNTGEIPDFAQAYHIVEVNGIRVGLIGFTTVETKVDTQPSHVEGIEFLSYAEVLPEAASEAREAGAELLLIIGHLCAGETRALADDAAANGIYFLGGGHCHEEINEIVGSVRIVESGFPPFLCSRKL